MARQRNPRRIVVEFLQGTKKDFSSLIGRWDVTGRVYLHPHERPEPGVWSRTRQRHEYPENDPRHWAQLAADAEEIAQSLSALACFAREQRAEVLNRQTETAASR